MVVATMQVAAQHLAAPWLKDALAQKYHWHTLFARTLEAASELASRNISPDLFNTYVILGSRWFSHHESVEALLASGRYGDCMVLLRSLLEDTDLMTYFACYPEDAAEWKERLSREPVWSDEVYRRGIRKFRMPQIWKMLKERGIEPVGERDYPVLSATVHASPWGIRFYGRTLSEDPDSFISAWHRPTMRQPPSRLYSFSRGPIRDPFRRSSRVASLPKHRRPSGAQ